MPYRQSHAEGATQPLWTRDSLRSSILGERRHSLNVKSRPMSAVLYGVQSMDPLAFVVAPIVLVSVAQE